MERFVVFCDVCLRLRHKKRFMAARVIFVWISTGRVFVNCQWYCSVDGAKANNRLSVGTKSSEAHRNGQLEE